MRELNLDILKNGLPGITPKKGAALLEAISYCLDKCGHKPGVVFELVGAMDESLVLIWNESFDRNASLFYNDQEELVEEAAIGIALCFIHSFTKYQIFLRSRKGTGADFWVGTSSKEDKSIQEGLLEVSGLMKETKNNTVSKRVANRKLRLENSPYKHVPKLIFAVEFDTPKAKYLQL